VAEAEEVEIVMVVVDDEMTEEVVTTEEEMIDVVVVAAVGKDVKGNTFNFYLKSSGCSLFETILNFLISVKAYIFKRNSNLTKSQFFKFGFKNFPSLEKSPLC